MRIIVLSFIILVAVMSPLWAESDPPVGIRTMTIVTSDTGREVVLTMWYPAGTGGETLLVGDTPVFLGVTARSDASIEDGSFPLVLVSHGGMRSAPNMAGWIGFGLARHGFVVAVVRPPGLGPRDAAAAVSEVWKRPADLSAVITALEHDPGWAAHIDFDRIGSLGFFLGGTTVLSLAGARMSAEGYARSCDEGSTAVDCGWFAVNDVDLREIDVRPSARSNRDSRIKVAIAVDPELTAI
ncbi:MAG: hypothetical protein MI892_21550, partial [Desulfobacterales bacterium]|nr:hypothetical protein [Desulfobacterales bacterium]